MAELFANIDRILIPEGEVLRIQRPDTTTIWLIQRTLSYGVDDSAHGTVTGTAAGKYAWGTSVSITATANYGWQFSGWYIGDTLVSTNETYTFLLKSNDHLTARFIVQRVVYFEDYTTSGGNSASASAPADGNVSSTALIPGRTLYATTRWSNISSSVTSDEGRYYYTINGTEQSKHEATTFSCTQDYSTVAIPIPEGCTNIRISTGEFTDGVSLDISLCYME